MKEKINLTPEEKKKIYYQKNRETLLRLAKIRYRKIKKNPEENEKLKAYDRARQRKNYRNKSKK